MQFLGTIYHLDDKNVEEFVKNANFDKNLGHIPFCILPSLECHNKVYLFRNIKANFDFEVKWMKEILMLKIPML